MLLHKINAVLGYYHLPKTMDRVKVTQKQCGMCGYGEQVRIKNTLICLNCLTKSKVMV